MLWKLATIKKGWSQLTATPTISAIILCPTIQWNGHWMTTPTPVDNNSQSALGESELSWLIIAFIISILYCMFMCVSVEEINRS